MRQFANGNGLVKKLVAQLGHERLLALSAYSHVKSICITVAEVLRKELLDRDTFIKHRMQGLVGTAETATLDEADYSVFTSLKDSAGLQMHNLFYFFLRSWSWGGGRCGQKGRAPLLPSP